MHRHNTVIICSWIAINASPVESADTRTTAEFVINFTDV